MLAESDRLRARDLMQLFDLVRIAVNGDKAEAQEYYDALRKRAGIEEPEKPKVVIASPEEYRRLFGGR